MMNEPMDAIRNLTVARAFRSMLVWFGVQQVTALVLQLNAAMAEGIQQDDPIIMVAVILSFGGLLVVAVATVMMLIHVYRLASALNSMALLWVVLMLVPCLNLAILLILNTNASNHLKMHGIPVGFLGPSRETIAALERAVSS